MLFRLMLSPNERRNQDDAQVDHQLQRIALRCLERLVFLIRDIFICHLINLPPGMHQRGIHDQLQRAIDTQPKSATMRAAFIECGRVVGVLLRRWLHAERLVHLDAEYGDSWESQRPLCYERVADGLFEMSPAVSEVLVS